MTSIDRRRKQQAFTLIELLVVLIILGILSNVALPSYISSVYASRMETANANAKALATAAQGKAIVSGSYDTTLTDYAIDMGGSIPINPCSGTTSGYTITDSGTQCSVVATAGTNCGAWAPTTYVLGYSGE